ncbi:MAG: hypothetical protein U0271_34870 [Polyangiaceae bacterium]
MIRCCVAGALVLAGCGSSGSADHPTSAASSSSAAPSASATVTTSASTATSAATVSAHASASASPSDRFACESDGDCTNSCMHGAVAMRWYEANYPGGEACDDGCTSKGTEPAKCEQKRCVAYAQGKRAPECTNLDKPVVPGPGPAHRCTQDTDCRMSCRYGAVNKLWYEYRAKDECKDGCARGNSPRCEGGVCTAYRNGKLDADCTQRSIFSPD